MFHFLRRWATTPRPVRATRLRSALLRLGLPGLLLGSLAAPAQAQSGRYEAENAQVLGSATIGSGWPGYSGSGFVEYITNVGTGVSFSVYTDAQVPYHVSLRYATGGGGGTRTMSLFLNGAYVRQTSLPATSNWDTWASKTEVLTLPAGTSTVEYRYTNNDTGGINIDYLWTSKVAANGPIATPITLGDQLLVRKLVTIPDRSGGARPLLNTMAYTGSRLFVGEQIEGKIYELVPNSSGGKTPVLFLNVGAAVAAATGRQMEVANNPQHGGLRGLAFHPDFATNGKFYTSIMEQRPSSTAGHHYVSDNSQIPADAVVVEWTYSAATQTVNAASYREVLRIGMPVYDHPIKQIDFNRFAQPGDADYGLLYIAHGDGSQQSATAGGGQRNDALGKILRVNPLQSGSNSYTIPSTNPFVSDPNWLDEIYALGFRNPHTFTFERSANGRTHLVVGEAGRDNVEEINVVVSGGDYGWPKREGTFEHFANGGGIVQGVAPLPAVAPPGEGNFIYPAAQWGHHGPVGEPFVGQANAGGYALINPLDNRKYYLFADFADAGRIFYADFEQLVGTTQQVAPGASPASLTQATVRECAILFDHDSNVGTPALARYSMRDVFNDEPSYTGNNRTDLRFGQGPGGEVYILSKTNGLIYQVQSLRTPAATAYSLEAEDARTNTTRNVWGSPNRRGNYSGTGYVEDMTNVGTYVGFDVSVPVAGVYLLDLRYSAGAGNRTMSVYVNGTDVVQAAFPATASWGDWATQTAPVYLAAGANTITYQYDSNDSGWINPDVLKVRPSTYEAEDATFNSNAADYYAGYRGTGYVEYLTNVGNYVSFQVYVPTAGTYPVDLRYAAGAGDRTMSVYVNGTDVVQAQFPNTNDWATWATQTANLYLTAGSNTITYQYDASDSGWINADYLQVREVACTGSISLNATQQMATTCYATYSVNAINMTNAGTDYRWFIDGAYDPSYDNAPSYPVTVDACYPTVNVMVQVSSSCGGPTLVAQRVVRRVFRNCPCRATAGNPYPNPADKYLTVSTPEAESFTTKRSTSEASTSESLRTDLYNSFGQLVLTATGTTATPPRLDTEKLPAGMYHVVISQAGKEPKRHTIQITH